MKLFFSNRPVLSLLYYNYIKKIFKYQAIFQQKTKQARETRACFALCANKYCEVVSYAIWLHREGLSVLRDPFGIALGACPRQGRPRGGNPGGQPLHLHRCRRSFHSRSCAYIWKNVTMMAYSLRPFASLFLKRFSHNPDKFLRRDLSGEQPREIL